jgi:hypothetical protein
MEALRRVEKPGVGTGSYGAAVASYTKAPPRWGAAIPLLLGLAAGGALALLLGPPSPQTPAAPAGRSAEASAPPLKGGAALPPPLFPEPAPVPRTASISDAPKATAPALIPTPAPPAVLTLQAISERDSQPIAVINDLLVRVGDRIGLARVVKIGPDFVEVVHDSGRHDTVRFALPPPPSPEASATPSSR